MGRKAGVDRARMRAHIALAVALVVAACGGDGTPATTLPAAEAAPPPSTQPAPATTPTTTIAAPPTTSPLVVDGLNRHVDAAQGFSVLLPDGWRIVTPDDADIDAFVAALGDTEFEGMGDQIRSAFDAGGKLFAFSEGGADPDFIDNINILVTEAPPVPPSEAVEATARGFEDLGAVDVAVELVELAPGPAVRVEYTLPSLGTQGIAYAVRIGKLDWNITLTAADMSVIEFDFEDVARSLHVD